MSYSGSPDGVRDSVKSKGKRDPFAAVEMLAPPHAAVHGVIRHNYLVMRQRAFNKAYNTKVPTDCMVVIDVLLDMPLIGEEATATNLKKRVSKVLEKNTLGPALEAIKECLRRDMIAFMMKGATKIYGFTHEQKARSEAVSRYMKSFPDVTRAQIADSTNPTAGRDLLECVDVYFNIVEAHKEGQKGKGQSK
ncbi:hypothetical protein ACVII1_006266 [Bradyrhizobium elkanii]|uniref:hypothetical protein n=1 Tax=Bradyrhizobium TaxID=374 RepID=UPI002712147A|nr:hypothetical protein [Bradyrhizobium elkanii]WLA40198.1 hypothetical protein QNJ95_01040 [Bradyrhizobium elkanii]